MTRARNQRGAALLVVLVALSAMIALGGLAVLSVRGQTRAGGFDRFQTLALYGAESGIAAGMQFLRENRDVDGTWTSFVVADNDGAAPELGITGNTIGHGQPGNPFSTDTPVWYEVVILNNIDDPGLEAGLDTDAVVVLRATGHGPGGALAVVEAEFQPGPGPATPCNSYAQENQNELGSAFNPCLSAIDATQTASFQLNP